MSETRALTAALSGPVFDGAASRTAQHASDRHVDRWAPEGEGARRSAGMRSLAFADQVASPWMSAASYSRMSRTFAGHATGASSSRAVPSVSWLFPRPWYQDELDWMAAARQGLESSPSRGAMTTRGTFMSPSGGESAWSGIAMPVLSADVMASVSPSMSDSSGSPMGALRAWSPNVDFAAAAAAEVVAGTMRTVADAGLPGIAGRSPIWSGLSVVTPHALASSHAPSSYAAPASSYATTSSAAYAPSTSYATTSSATPTTSSYLPTAMGVAPTASESAAVESARMSLARIESRLEQLRAPSGAATSTAATGSPAASAEAGAGVSSMSSEAAPPVALSAGESNLAGAAQTSPSASSALRTVELLLAAVAARSGASSSVASSSSYAASPAATGASASSDGGSYASSGGFASDGASAAAASMSSADNFAPSAGPRVAMPAGLGGLVQSLAARQSVARPMAQVRDAGAEFAPTATAAALSGAAALAGMAAEGIGPSSRAPVAGPSGFSPVWAAPAAGALASLSASPARAIDHLSWSDRWLARFSGASPLAMSAFDSGTEASAPTLRQLAVGSPEVVYVHPQLAPASISSLAARSQGVEPLSDRAARSAPAMTTVVPPTVARSTEAPRGALRLDDSESVPDSVFAAIAAAAAAPVRRDAPIGPTPVSARPSSAAEASAPSLTAPGSTAPVDLLGVGRRLSVADLLSVSAPTAPDAGLAPSLASSPMAPALAAVLPLPTAPVFDPRALQGSALTSAYLGGLVARSAAPVGVLTGAPTLAALARAGADAPSSIESSAWMQRDLALAPSALRLASAAPQTDFVMPMMRDARGRAVERYAPIGEAPRGVAPSATAPTAASPTAASLVDDAPAGQLAAAPASIADSISSRADIAAAIAAGAPAELIARMVESRGLETELLALRSAMLAAPTASSVPLAHAAHAPLVSASVPVPSTAAATDASSSLAPAGGVVHGVASPLAAAQARTSAAAFADAMTFAHAGMPGVGAPASHHASSLATAGGRPGSLAEAALAWSVAEERSAANLSFDFVTPEMVLAAKVYGLPPGAAAEAVRLAASGPASMASMATQLDLTLLRAFQSSASGAPAGAFAPGAASSSMISRSVDPARAAEQARIADAAQAAVPSSAQADAAQAASLTATAQPASTAAPSYASAPGYDATPGAMPPGYGLPLTAATARLPRGAFLWPSGAVAALGLRALSPDGAAGLPVAALELLAAQAVADLGTWVTAFPGLAQGIDPAFLPAGAAGAMTHVVQGAAGPMTFATAGGPAAPGAPGALSPGAIASWSEPAQVEADAVEASSSMAVPTSVRSRFESVYVALARSSEGQSLSPAARAARAMALLTSSTPGLSTRDAAAASWAMLPSVYTGGLDMVAPVSVGADAAGSPDLRPGLAGLAARAGESIGSFVTPSAAEVAGVGRHSDAAPAASPSSSAARAPAAEPVYVDTASRGTERSSPFSTPRPGRTFTQYGGGEPEIPTWFESAAQRMFASSGDERAGMSLAQMVLVTAMPQQQVAAATRGGGSSGGTGTPGGGGGKQGAVDKPDVDKLALEVFQEVLHLLEIARQRSGDPFQ